MKELEAHISKLLTHFSFIYWTVFNFPYHFNLGQSLTSGIPVLPLLWILCLSFSTLSGILLTEFVNIEGVPRSPFLLLQTSGCQLRIVSVWQEASAKVRWRFRCYNWESASISQGCCIYPHHAEQLAMTQSHSESLSGDTPEQLPRILKSSCFLGTNHF